MTLHCDDVKDTLFDDLQYEKDRRCCEGCNCFVIFMREIYTKRLKSVEAFKNLTTMCSPITWIICSVAASTGMGEAAVLTLAQGALTAALLWDRCLGIHLYSGRRLCHNLEVSAQIH